MRALIAPAAEFEWRVVVTGHRSVRLASIPSIRTRGCYQYAPTHDETAKLLDAVLCAKLAESANASREQRLTRRYAKLRQMGKWETAEATSG